MKRRIWLVLALALIWTPVANAAPPRDDAAVSYKARLLNLAATRGYFAHLVGGTTLRVAELTLFTSMMPKGGDLHHHYSGAIYAETYLDWVAAQHYCVYTSAVPERKIEPFQIETKPGSAPASCVSADTIRGDAVLYGELIKRWSNRDYGNHFHEQPPPDRQFFGTFGYVHPVSHLDYRRGLQGLKARAVEENMGYLETMLRSAPATDNGTLDRLLNPLKADTPRPQVEEALSRACNLLDRDAAAKAGIDAYVKAVEAAAAGLDDDRFTVRFQAYASRNATPARVFSSLYASFAAAKRSRLIVGVNIVGPEHGPVAMRDYRLHMQMFAFLKKRFPGVKLSLHAGELAPGLVPPEALRFHIREAVVTAGADRIGHGVDIVHETDAVELLGIMKRQKVVVEINLTSNAFILGVRDEAHPVRLYARYGVPFVISTDDAGVSRNSLSGEYLLYVCRYRPSYDALKETVYNSIRYAFLPEKEKTAEIAKLDKRFAEFEARMADLARVVR